MENENVSFQNINGIVRVEYFNNQIIRIAEAKKIVAQRLEFSKAKKHLLLICVPVKISINKAARDYLASEEGLQNIMASALVVSTKYSFFLSNFFVKLNPPTIPVKIFNKEEKAIVWLQQQSHLIKE
jgi:hypothetical protein